jgi:quercetin dioxygenase-like cupin family protein
MEPHSRSEFTVIRANEAEDAYADQDDVPGEFRRLTEALRAEQVAITLIRVPPHSDFEQGTGHRHERTEELYLVTRGELTMRFGDEVRRVEAGSVARVAPDTVRSHRNEGDEPVDVWAISVREGGSDSIKVEEFWEASPRARQSGSEPEDAG